MKPTKRKVRKVTSKVGMAPGTLVFTGEQKMDHVAVTVFQYDVEVQTEKQFPNIEAALKFVDDNKDLVNWINIDGLHDVSVIEKISAHFKLHRLTAEDILSVNQRPKIEEHEKYVHTVVKMLMIHQGAILDEQVTFILTGNTVITFQEKKGDVFDYVRKRIAEGKGQIRRKKNDYLFYALLDAVVDQYYVILESFGEKIEEIELSLLDNPGDEVLKALHDSRREALNLRRSVYPLRELVSRFEKLEEPFLSSDTQPYVRDLYDHTIQVIDNVEVFREMASGMLDLYMNSLSNRMNNVMKVLTIIATIFIPLTFIAGVYGMNFTTMPELEWEWGYPFIMGIMGLIMIGMIVFFKKKKWF